MKQSVLSGCEAICEVFIHRAPSLSVLAEERRGSGLVRGVVSHHEAESAQVASHVSCSAAEAVGEVQTRADCQ